MNTKRYQTLYIVRHGQTPNNKMKYIHGRGYMPDCPLNETGQQQAEEFYEKHQNISISKVYTSSLLRSQLSVKKFIEKYPHEISSDLDEVHFGKLEGTPIVLNGKFQLKDVFAAWKNKEFDEKVEGGQSFNEVVQQQKRIMKKITEENGDVLIAMHLRSIVILLSWMLEIPYDVMMNIKPDNLELFVVQFDREKKVFVDCMKIRERAEKEVSPEAKFYTN